MGSYTSGSQKRVPRTTAIGVMVTVAVSRVGQAGSAHIPGQPPTELQLPRAWGCLPARQWCPVPVGSSLPHRQPLHPPGLTLTCDSVIPSEYASRALSGPAKYLVCSKVFSRAKIWWPVKVGRVCFFLWMLSPRGSGAGRRKEVCPYCVECGGVPAQPCPACPTGRAPLHRSC